MHPQKPLGNYATIRTLWRSPFAWVQMTSGGGRGSDFSTMKRARLQRIGTNERLAYRDRVPLIARCLRLGTLLFRNPLGSGFKYPRRQFARQEVDKICLCFVRVPYALSKNSYKFPTECLPQRNNQFVREILDLCQIHFGSSPYLPRIISRVPTKAARSTAVYA